MIPEDVLGTKKTSILILVYNSPENNDKNSSPKKWQVNAKLEHFNFLQKVLIPIILFYF